jgi:hypothetical protein
MRSQHILLFIALAMLVEVTSCGNQKNEYVDTFEVVWKKLNETYFGQLFT